MINDCSFAGGFYWQAGKALFGLIVLAIFGLFVFGFVCFSYAKDERGIKKRRAETRD